ncbi:MAG: hypothetical protein JWQ21_630 [Herminiimonas sp.]|nr:hypothetical protein [Herminiimonas sp.]
MNTLLRDLIHKLDSPLLHTTKVIRWGAPVPVFGDISSASVATLGLNPSNLEFVDRNGKELEGDRRRFHTLSSLGLDSWSNARSKHIDLIADSCKEYFHRNPYDGWFKALDQLISGTNTSYYAGQSGACHLDLIPFATDCKWTSLSSKERQYLLNHAGDTLGLLLRDSPVKMLLLNGQSVIDNFRIISNGVFEEQVVPAWTLHRQSGPNVKGVRFTGTVCKIGDIPLKRDLLIIGYNHNIQSSFGVTNQVKNSMRSWVTKTYKGVSN